MRRQALLVFPLIALAACGSSEPTSYNAGSWQSLPNPGGSVTTFSFDTSGASIRGQGSSTGLMNQGHHPFEIAGERTFRYLILDFKYRNGETYQYLANFDGPDRLVGSVTDQSGVTADSVIYVRR